MKFTKSLTNAALLLTMLISTSTHAFSVPSVPEIEAFDKLAKAVCTSVNDIRGERTEIKVQGSIKASFNNWIGKITGIDGIKVNGLYHNEKNQGILAKDIAVAIKNGTVKGDACKLEVFNQVAYSHPVTVD